MQLLHMIPGVNIIGRKVCSEIQWSWVGRGVCGCSETPAGPLRKFLGSEEHLNWLKIDLNEAEIITVQD